MNYPTLENIQNALMLISPYVHRTPVITSELLNQLFECHLFFKCENMQKAGAFKYRGATHAVLCLTDAEKLKGVATHSSGNHAAALSKAASLRGIPAYIVMPKNAPKVKIEAVRAYGGIITFCEPSLQARESELQKVIEKTGAILVHPYDNFNVVCGQGTACLEIAEQMEVPDIVMAPVGGGGLLSGTAISAKNIWPNIRVIGAEPFNASDAIQSFKNKKLIPVQNPNTIADGLRTSLSPFTYSIILNFVDDILPCSETAIVDAMALIFQYLKVVVEPSSAVPLSIIIENKDYFKDKKVAIILSGGNVDLADLPF
jgi:threonine dehydratase